MPQTVFDWTVLTRILENQGVAISIIAVLLWFLIFKGWPWYTTVYFPAQEARSKDQLATLVTISNTMIEMKVQSLANGTRLEYLEEQMRKLHIMWAEHDTWERKIANAPKRMPAKRTPKVKVA